MIKTNTGLIFEFLKTDKTKYSWSKYINRLHLNLELMLCVMQAYSTANRAPLDLILYCNDVVAINYHHRLAAVECQKSLLDLAYNTRLIIIQGNHYNWLYWQRKPITSRDIVTYTYYILNLPHSQPLRKASAIAWQSRVTTTGWQSQWFNIVIV